MFQNHHRPCSFHKQTWKNRLLFVTAFLISFALLSQSVQAADEAAAEKEWTFLLFLNGHNNLDHFGKYNINQMEEIGSNENLNLVVQWASLENGGTQRLLIQKDSNKSEVTTTPDEVLKPVDMGNYKELIEFIHWGVQKYPAKKYFIAVWNHGNGWQRLGNSVQTRDISYDDLTGNRITTEQLGLAMSAAAEIIGHKVDIYGSDACLMAMAEVAGEMKNSVEYFVGSEEVEPGYGWPYTTFMQRWASAPQATAAEVSKALTEEYLKAYDGGIYGYKEVTFSAFDMSKFDGFLNALKGLNTSLSGLSATALRTVKSQANATQNFTYSDYRDLGHFIGKLAKTNIGVNSAALSGMNTAIQDLVIANGGTGYYADTASGVAIWLPTLTTTLKTHQERYAKFEMNKATQWLDFLVKLNP